MYQTSHMISDADKIAREIRESTSEKRVAMQPSFGRVLQNLEQAGVPIPARLRNLHEQLLEEAMEARFDNLPV